MTAFEFFESGMALAGARIGAVRISDLVKYDIYKEYKEMIERMKNEMPWQTMAEIRAKARKDLEVKRGYSQSTISRCITYFER